MSMIEDEMAGTGDPKDDFLGVINIDSELEPDTTVDKSTIRLKSEPLFTYSRDEVFDIVDLISVYDLSVSPPLIPTDLFLQPPPPPYSPSVNVQHATTSTEGPSGTSSFKEKDRARIRR